jgi:hypothetical protein
MIHVLSVSLGNVVLDLAYDRGGLSPATALATGRAPSSRGGH